MVYKWVFKMKVCIFIDGANFFYGVRTINKKYSDMSFDFERYINYLIRDKEIVVKTFYYNGALKKLKGLENLFVKQLEFFKRLRKIKNFTIILCKRHKRLVEEREQYIIKGDDVNLAVDMLKCSYENICEKFILVSGDGDFIPVIKNLKEKNKKIELCYFEKNISQKLLKEFEVTHLINKKILNKFFYRENENGRTI